MKAQTVFSALVCFGLGLPTVASASCFFIYGGDNQLIYRSTRAPVDLSKQIHDGLRGRFAGAHLTMIPDETGCPELLANGISEVFASSGYGTTTSGRSAIDASPLFRGVGDSVTGTGNPASASPPSVDASARPSVRRAPAPGRGR